MTNTRDILLDTAEKNIRERGYHAVSFRDLASALDIKSASVHYYFRQKHELGVAVVERYQTHFFEALDHMAQNATDEKSRIAAIRNAYRESLIQSDLMCLCGMMGAESNGLPDDVRNAINRFFKANIKWVEAAMDPAKPAKQRKESAIHIIATLQGGFMLATSLKNQKLFDQSTACLVQ